MFVIRILSLLLMTPTLFSYPHLSVPSGNEISVTLANYQYKEPDAEVLLQGIKKGLDYTYTHNMQRNAFIRTDIRYAYGTVDYSSTPSGSLKGNAEWYWELRALVGKNIFHTQNITSFYTGYGYRYLFDDIRGITTMNTLGYRRESQYFYIPLGFTHRLQLPTSAVVALTLEYDYFLHGTQKSFMSDALSDEPDAKNNQPSGYGIKGSVAYEKNQWAIGPYFHYWDVEDSEENIFIYNVDGVYWKRILYEPDNTTLEAGMKVQYRF